MTVAQFLQVLWKEHQANSAAMLQMAQALMNNQQGRNKNGHSTLLEFMRNLPPTFTEIVEPLDVDDWIRTMGDLLALVNCNEQGSFCPSLPRRYHQEFGGMDSRSRKETV
ncbi:hypothetical protein D1007_13605 [Hordeum vulgare]|nr:hypothetical protein D1007_13605 [Hordeum vulgare]